MPYSITYPDSGQSPQLARLRLSDSGVGLSPIGGLEPCDPTDLETDLLGLYLAGQRRRVEPGTVIRLGARTFACVRASIIAYYHLS